MVVGTGGLASLVRETVEEACLRCWFSRVLLAWLVLSDGAAHSSVGMVVVLVAARLPLLGVCSQETSTPWTWSMVARAVCLGPSVPVPVPGGGDDAVGGSSRVRVRGEQQQQQLRLVVLRSAC